MVLELDTVLGDCSVSILEKETTIMIFLTECILGKSAQLLKIGSLISELDWYSTHMFFLLSIKGIIFERCLNDKIHCLQSYFNVYCS